MNAKRPLILIVDDDPSLRETISLWLSGAGYRTAVAGDGREGLAAVVRDRPALILLDLRMPVLDGFGFLSGLAELPEKPPVIVISGRGEVGDVVESFKRGVTDYIQKPVESYELLEHAVKTAIDAAGVRQRMLRAEARYSNLVQNLPLLVFALRRDFSLEFINKACRSMLGFSRGPRPCPGPDGSSIASIRKTGTRCAPPLTWPSPKKTRPRPGLPARAQGRNHDPRHSQGHAGVARSRGLRAPGGGHGLRHHRPGGTGKALRPGGKAQDPGGGRRRGGP